MRWAQEDKDLVKLLLLEGYTNKEAASESGVPENTVKTWKAGWKISSRASYKELYEGTVQEVQDRLIKIMQEAPRVSYTYFNSKDSSVPSATVYRKYFGSWDNALSAAGITNSCIMKPDKLTHVYLVEFDGFYKIGITQQEVHDRLGGRYPEYTILIDLVLPFLEAKALEAQWLKEVKPYQYIPTNFPAEGRGFTECFKI